MKEEATKADDMGAVIEAGQTAAVLKAAVATAAKRVAAKRVAALTEAEDLELARTATEPKEAVTEPAKAAVPTAVEARVVLTAAATK
eukprot:scaffold59357_cov18-Phaeocystis_antarctica.AAC.1